MRVVGYVRVSTREQGESGLGLEAQRAAIQSEADRRGWELITIEEDIASGKHADNRPGLTRALASCQKRHAGGIIVAKLDRITRSVGDFDRLLQQARRERWNLAVLDIGLDLSTPYGEAMANMMATFAQLERRLISQRIKEALAVKRSQGWAGPPPPPVPPRQVNEHARRRISELHAAGYGPERIARQLNTEGIPAVGTRWHRTTVRRVLAQG